MICVIERTEYGYRAFLEEIPSCTCTGQTVEHAVRGIREALCRHFQKEPTAIPMTFESRAPYFTIQAYYPAEFITGA